MALKNILARLLTDFGGDIGSQRLYWIDKINLASRDIYNAFPIVHAIREEVFEIPKGSTVISLPSHVNEIMAIRDHETDEKVKVVDLLPKYQTTSWQSKLDWKIVRRDSPTKDSWLEDSPIIISLAEPADKAFFITITGRTQKASKIDETLTFAVGDETKTTAKVFKAGMIESIRKNTTTNMDLTVKTISDTVIAEIPNNELFPSYLIVEVKTMPTDYSRLVDILYKVKFTPLINDNDQFLGTDVYDDAIYWNTLTFIWAKNADSEGMMGKIQLAANKALYDLQKIFESYNTGKTYRVDFGENPFIRMFNEL